MYGPTGRFGKRYAPVSFETVVRMAPVAVWVTLMSAPGNTAPLVSRTVPLICAVVCANAAAQKRNKTGRHTGERIVLQANVEIGRSLHFKSEIQNFELDWCG